MTTRWCRCLAAGLLALQLQAQVLAGDGRAWTTRDSVAVRYFVAQERGNSNGLDGFTADPIAPSPDGRHLFFVTRRGDFAADQIVAELQVFSVEAIHRALSQSARDRGSSPPLRAVTFRSSASDPIRTPISEAHWEDDDSVIFAGVAGTSPRQIYRLDIGTGRVEQLSDIDGQIVDLSTLAQRGRSLVYDAYYPEPWTPLKEYPMVAIVGDELEQLGREQRGGKRLLVSHRGRPARAVAALAHGSRLYGAWISPDERWAMVVMAPKEPPPESWAAYERWPTARSRFMLVDLERGLIRPLLDAPAGTATKVGAARGRPFFDTLWSADSRRAIVVNTALPLSDGADERGRMAYVIDYAVETGEWSIVEPIGGVDRSKVCALQPCTTERSDRVALAHGITVKLRQSANDPPAVIASNGRSEIALTGADEALDGIWRAQVRPVEWRDTDGHIIVGGLLLPRDQTTAQPVPLVIQAYRYQPEFFRPDGIAFGAYAAQPLAAQGMAVLLMEIPSSTSDGDGTNPSTTHWKTVTGLQEGEVFVRNVDAAVESLASRGIIDSRRVGLIGFSRGGYMTYHAITNPGRTKLAAAIVDDAHTGGYFEYVMYAAESPSFAGGPTARSVESQYGAGTFWENKASWLEHAPPFNVDRVQTPTLFRMGLMINAPIMAETVGAFRLNRRPFEYLFFPNGAHQLQRPRERLAMLDATVDWMAFWLQGKLPADATRRVRWKGIASEWQATQREP